MHANRDYHTAHHTTHKSWAYSSSSMTGSARICSIRANITSCCKEGWLQVLQNSILTPFWTRCCILGNKDENNAPTTAEKFSFLYSQSQTLSTKSSFMTSYLSIIIAFYRMAPFTDIGSRIYSLFASSEGFRLPGPSWVALPLSCSSRIRPWRSISSTFHRNFLDPFR